MQGSWWVGEEGKHGQDEERGEHGTTSWTGSHVPVTRVSSGMVGVQIGYGKMEQLLEQVLRPQHQTHSTTIAILNPMFAQHCIGHSSAMLSHSEISYEGHLSKTFDVEEKNELLRFGLLKKCNKQTNRRRMNFNAQCAFPRPPLISQKSAANILIFSYIPNIWIFEYIRSTIIDLRNIFRKRMSLSSQCASPHPVSSPAPYSPKTTLSLLSSY